VVATIQSRADIACMHAVRHATPVWVKALLAAVILGAPSWWLVERHDRRAACGSTPPAGPLTRPSCGRSRATSSTRWSKGGARTALACAERSGAACGTEVEELALAVDVLAHESWHLAGVIDEAVTECRAVQTIAWTAVQLGATEPQGRALARAYLETGYPRLPERYRSGACADGGELDLRPDDGAWA
jgi:hypothetical protein